MSRSAAAPHHLPPLQLPPPSSTEGGGGGGEERREEEEAAAAAAPQPTTEWNLKGVLCPAPDPRYLLCILRDIQRRQGEFRVQSELHRHAFSVGDKFDEMLDLLLRAADEDERAGRAHVTEYWVLAILVYLLVHAPARLQLAARDQAFVTGHFSSCLGQWLTGRTDSGQEFGFTSEHMCSDTKRLHTHSFVARMRSLYRLTSWVYE